MRIDRLLSNSGYGSRTEVRDLIRSGRVTLAGGVVRDPGQAVRDDQRAQVAVDGRAALIRRYYYLMLDKPAGVVTALDDPHHRTVAEFIPPAYRHADLFPVGRLDRDTTGLLVLTNDGTLGHRLASPRHGVEKTYDVIVSGAPFDDAADPDAFAAGIVLEDGLVCRPARLHILSPHHAELTIHEGKFHQVKRMMAATGRLVTALRRLTVGPLLVDASLGAGGVRELGEAEVEALYKAVELERPE